MNHTQSTHHHGSVPQWSDGNIDAAFEPPQIASILNDRQQDFTQINAELRLLAESTGDVELTPKAADAIRQSRPAI